MTALHNRRERMASLDQAVEMAEVVSSLPFEVRLWHAQNIWYEILESLQQRRRFRFRRTKPPSWEARFKTLGRSLGIAVDELVLEDDGASTWRARPSCQAARVCRPVED